MQLGPVRAVGRAIRKANDRIGAWELSLSVFALFFAARLTSAYTWYWGAKTKHPWLDPPFGWLEGWLRTEMQYNPIPGYPWLIEHVFLPNITILGWMSFLVEAYLALVLFAGLFTRLHGVLAALWGLNIAIGNLGAPREPIWALIPMVLLPLLAAAGAAGRTFGADWFLRTRWQGTPGRVKGWLLRWCM